MLRDGFLFENTAVVSEGNTYSSSTAILCPRETASRLLHKTMYTNGANTKKPAQNWGRFVILKFRLSKRIREAFYCGPGDEAF
jgi:hypothetical protein